MIQRETSFTAWWRAWDAMRAATLGLPPLTLGTALATYRLERPTM